MIASKGTPLPWAVPTYRQEDYGRWIATAVLYGHWGSTKVSASGNTIGETEARLAAWIWLVTAAKGVA